MEIPAKDEKRAPQKRSRIIYDQEPDYTRPAFEIPAAIRQRMFNRLRFLYGEPEAGNWIVELERIIQVHSAHKPLELIELEKNFDLKERFTQEDMVLITYGDLIPGDERTLLATLHKAVNTYNRGAVNTIHILPFFPYSSDRGFSIIDFNQVDPKLGTWEDIRAIEADYDLMFDGVLNHCSSRSRMFREFLNGNPFYKNFFIAYDSPDDLTPDQRSKIFRPRTSDILTKYHTLNGPKYVWTTFSEDQIDLNFRNPATLMRVIEGLLFYVRRGADLLRLDAVTYVWAEPGTECVHLPETHAIVKLIRDVMDTAAPGVALITETNVPHKDNVSYFGDGEDEAHMVYNFALPPLVLHAFYREDATTLSKWAQGLKTPSELTHFFNILDTHDGIGLMGVKEILPKDEIDFLVHHAQTHGAYVSFKMGSDGIEEPYEINSTWWSVLNRDDSREDLLLQVKRFVASRAISFSLRGVPGNYIHGVLGSRNDHDLARQTGVKRDVNRSVLDANFFTEAFKDSDSKFSLIGRYYPRISLPRARERAFHPGGAQRVLMTVPEIFSVLRTSPEGDQHILTLTNVTRQDIEVSISLQLLKLEFTHWFDLVEEKPWIAEGEKLRLSLGPYDVLWLKPAVENSQNLFQKSGVQNLG